MAKKYGPDEPVAVLGSAELAVYEQARTALESHRDLRLRAHAAYAQAQYVERALEHEFVRVMTALCEGRGLPTNGGYTVDQAGRVFRDGPHDTDQDTTVEDEG